MIKTVRVSDKGQIAIPQSIRASMGIKKGDELLIVQVEGKMMIQKANYVEEELKDDFGDLLRLSESSYREIWDNKEDEIWATYLKKGKKCK